METNSRKYEKLSDVVIPLGTNLRATHFQHIHTFL